MGSICCSQVEDYEVDRVEDMQSIQARKPILGTIRVPNDFSEAESDEECEYQVDVKRHDSGGDPNRPGLLPPTQSKITESNLPGASA